MNIKISVSEELFTRWAYITQNLLHLNAIIQNEGEVTIEQVLEFTQFYANRSRALELVYRGILQQIREDNPKLDLYLAQAEVRQLEEMLK